MGIWETEWDELCATLKGNPFFGGFVGARSGGGHTVLTVDRSRTASFVLRVVAMLSSVTVLGFVLLMDTSVDGARWGIGSILGLGMLVISLAMSAICLLQLGLILRMRRRIRLSPEPRMTAVLDGREFAIPVADTRVRLLRYPGLAKGDPDFATKQPGPGRPGWGSIEPFRLELFRQAADGTETILCLSHSATREHLLPMVTSLRALGVPVADETLLRVSLREYDVLVDADTLTRRLPNGTTRELVQLTESLAEIRPSRDQRNKQVLHILGGAGLFVVWMLAHRDTSVLSLVAIAVLSGFWVVAGILGLMGVTGFGTIRIDLSRGVMTLWRGAPPPVTELTDGLPLDRLAAIQLCVGQLGKVRPTVVHELNVILRGEDGARITLLEDRGRHRVEHAAVRLGAILDLPLIDSANGHQVIDGPASLPPIRFAAPVNPPQPVGAF